MVIPSRRTDKTFSKGWRIPLSQAEELRDIARMHGISVSLLLEYAVERFLSAVGQDGEVKH